MKKKGFYLFRVENISELKTDRDIWFYLLNNMETLTEEKRMEILTKKPDLKNAFDVLDLYATDPDKQQELDEDLQLFFFTKFYKLSNFKL